MIQLNSPTLSCSILDCPQEKIEKQISKRKKIFLNFVSYREFSRSRSELSWFRSIWSRCDVLALFSQPFFHPICSWPEIENPIYHDDDVFVLCAIAKRKPDPIFHEETEEKRKRKNLLYLLIDRLLKLIESRTCNLFSSTVTRFREIFHYDAMIPFPRWPHES